MARKTQQVETRLVSEYLQSVYGKFVTLAAVPLGRVSEELQSEVGYQKAINIMRPYRPEVDGLVVLPRHLVLIEAKVWNIVNGLAKLPLYKSLLPFTPELKNLVVDGDPLEGHLRSGLSSGVNDLTSREVILELVVAWTNPNLEIMARDADVRVVTYCPGWLGPIVAAQHNYWTKEYRAQREQKLQLREYFGLE